MSHSHSHFNESVCIWFLIGVPCQLDAKFGSQDSDSAASLCASVSVSTEERKEVAMAMAVANQSNGHGRCRKASWSMGVAMAEER